MLSSKGPVSQDSDTAMHLWSVALIRRFHGLLGRKSGRFLSLQLHNHHVEVLKSTPGPLSRLPFPILQEIQLHFVLEKSIAAQVSSGGLHLTEKLDVNQVLDIIYHEHSS